MSEQLAAELAAKKGDRSLRALARDLDVAVGTAEGWLNGWRSPDLKHLAKLSDYLGRGIAEIVEWELNAARPDDAPIIHGLSVGSTDPYTHDMGLSIYPYAA